jgi:hypothetical protein
MAIDPTRWETSDVPRHVWLRPELQNEVTPEVTPELVGSRTITPPANIKVIRPTQKLGITLR